MVGVKVNVGVRLGVKVAVGVRVMVGVNVGVRDGVGVAVEGGPMYSTSMERKSTYPPDAVRDQERQPVGTAIAILTNPGSPEPVCKYHVSTEEHARNTALPTLESGVKPTMISKYETSRSKEPLATPPFPSHSNKNRHPATCPETPATPLTWLYGCSILPYRTNVLSVRLMVQNGGLR